MGKKTLTDEGHESEEKKKCGISTKSFIDGRIKNGEKRYKSG